MDEILGDPGGSFPQNGLPGLIDSLDRLLSKLSHRYHFIDTLYHRDLLSARGILLALLGLLLLLVIPPFCRWILRRVGHLQANFRQERIPQSYGIVILLWSAIMLSANAYLLSRRRTDDLLWLIAVLGYGLLGLLDDIWGDRTIKGLKGHFRAALREGKITTGLLKAVGGGVLALVIGYRLAGGDLPQAQSDVILNVILNVIINVILNSVLIALSANAINLFDLRPGRACTIFLILAMPLLFLALASPIPGTPPLLLIIIPALIIWPRDASAQAMLGDAGSNLLGATLGMALCGNQVPLPVRLLALTLLVGLHILTERVSLTALIEKTPLLDALDRLTGERDTKNTEQREETNE